MAKRISPMHTRRFVALSFMALAACHGVIDAILKGDNPNSCDIATNIGQPGCPDAPPGVGGPCRDNKTCTLDGFPICDTVKGGGTCVACTAADSHQCTGTTPLCSSDEQCVRCTKHSDCTESNVCLPDGSCALSTTVAYVDGDHGVESAVCDKAHPCTKIEKAAAAAAIVKVTGTVSGKCTLDTQTVRIFADPNAKLVSMDGGDLAALEVKGNAKVEVHDLQISRMSGANIPTVSLAGVATLALNHVTISNNPGIGIDGSAGTLSVVRSTISGNVNGGIHLRGPTHFRIVGNVVFGNGAIGKGSGGLVIGVDAPLIGDPANEIEFNSISRNIGADLGQGIQCTTGTSLTGHNNIIWNNGILPATTGPSGLPQVDGNGCTYRTSDIGPVAIANNIGQDPSFVSEVDGDLHLMRASTVVRKADPTANLDGLASTDIDGDARTKTGTEMAADLGADQISK